MVTHEHSLQLHHAKEGFVDESHLYKKHKTQEIVHNTEETFAQKFINFMRKQPTICCVDA
jgi:hypothetical protein